MTTTHPTLIPPLPPKENQQQLLHHIHTKTNGNLRLQLSCPNVCCFRLSQDLEVVIVQVYICMYTITSLFKHWSQYTSSMQTLLLLQKINHLLSLWRTMLAKYWICDAKSINDVFKTQTGCCHFFLVHACHRSKECVPLAVLSSTLPYGRISKLQALLYMNHPWLRTKASWLLWYTF